jgi:TRAP-type C4-dicarboxylate transport system substrate-binding protein
MRLARRTLLASLMASVAAPALLRSARGELAPITLKLHHYFSSVSSVHDKFLAPFARKLEADSSGRIRVDIFPSMQLGGAPAQLFDQLRDGTADIVWAAPSHTPGRFPKIEVFELPFVASRRALVSSKAIQDFAAINLKDEFRDIHPLCFACRDRGVIHAKRAIQSMADIKDFKLHVQNPLAAAAMAALGAQGVPMPVPQVPMALTQHVIDGCLDPWGVVPALKLYDLKFHTEFPNETPSTTAFVLAMNRDIYDHLPRDLKVVVDANAGTGAAAMAGAMWDADAATAAGAARERGDGFIVLSPEEALRWRKATDPVVAAWLKQMKERHVDGGKLLAGARTLIAKYATEPEPQPPEIESKSQVAQPAAPPDRAIAAQPQPAPSPPQIKAELPASAKPILRQVPASPPAPAAPTVPVAKPAPALVPKPKELDIPL